MDKDKNFVVNFGSNGLKFKENSDNRPIIQDIDGGLFVIYHSQGAACIPKNDIDDLIILLQEVKDHGYKIDY